MLISLQATKAIISQPFKNVPGKHAVATDQFKIFDRVTGNLITNEEWASYAQPGARFVMAFEVWISHDKQSSCPRCYRMLEKPLGQQTAPDMW
jgi:hypothetical protein